MIKSFSVIVLAISLVVCCSKTEDRPKAPATPPFTALEEAKVANSEVQMKNIAQALDLYKVKFASYPTTEEGIKSLVDKEMLSKMPKDGWDNEFVYELVDPHTYKLKSLGADGKPGGEGSNMDIEHEQ